MDAATILLMCLLSVGIPAADGAGGAPTRATAPPMIDVTVKVSAHEDVRGPICKYLATGLRSLGDVQLVQEDPDWTIEVITTRLEDPNGALQAVGLSFVVEQHGPHMMMLEALAQACRYFIETGYLRGQQLDQDMRRLLEGVAVLPKPERLSLVAKHRMTVVTPDRLPQACREMVACFDAQRRPKHSQAAPTAPPDQVPPAPVDPTPTVLADSAAPAPSDPTPPAPGDPTPTVPADSASPAPSDPTPPAPGDPAPPAAAEGA